MKDRAMMILTSIYSVVDGFFVSNFRGQGGIPHHEAGEIPLLRKGSEQYGFQALASQS